MSEEACQKTKVDTTTQIQKEGKGRVDFLLDLYSKGRCVKDDNRFRVSSDVEYWKQVKLQFTMRVKEAGVWQVEEERSKMDGSPTVILGLRSTDTVHGWLETATPTLVVRCQEHKTSVYIVTGMAAQPGEGASSDAYPIELRFDEEKPTTQWWGQSTDNKGLGVWSSSKAIALSRRLAKANKLLFRFTPFNASPAIASFDLHGLDRLLPKVAHACDWR